VNDCCLTPQTNKQTITFYIVEIDDFGILALHTKPSQAFSEIDNIITVYNIVSQNWALKVDKSYFIF
jgi:hypothetical protein